MSALSWISRALGAPALHWTAALPLATAGAVLGLSLHQLGLERGPDPQPEAQVAGLRAAPEGEPCDAQRARLGEELAAVEAEVLRLDAARMKLKRENDAVEGPVVPWPSELRAELPALEAEVHAIAAHAGGELIEADCAEFPCLFHLAFPADPALEGWAAARGRLQRGGWTAEAETYLVVDPGLVLASPEDIEGHVILALLPPQGLVRGPEVARRLLHRRAALAAGVGAD